MAAVLKAATSAASTLVKAVIKAPGAIQSGVKGMSSVSIDVWSFFLPIRMIFNLRNKLVCNTEPKRNVIALSCAFPL